MFTCSVPDPGLEGEIKSFSLKFPIILGSVIVNEVIARMCNCT